MTTKSSTSKLMLDSKPLARKQTPEYRIKKLEDENMRLNREKKNLMLDKENLTDANFRIAGELSGLEQVFKLQEEKINHLENDLNLQTEAYDKLRINHNTNLTKNLDILNEKLALSNEITSLKERLSRSENKRFSLIVFISVYTLTLIVLAAWRYLHH